MQDREKTRSELLAEIAQLRRHLAVVERDRIDADMAGRTGAAQWEQRFRAIFENAADGMALADVQTWTFQEGNEAFARMLGYSPDQVRGLRVQDIHFPEDMLHIQEELAKQVNRRSALAANARMKRQDGSLLYADINSIPISLDGERFLLGIFRDVTDRIRAQRELEEIRTRYQDLMDNVSDIIYSTDRQGNLTSMSQAAKLLLGFDRDEIVGTHYRHWVPEDQLAKLEAARRQALEGRRKVVEIVLRGKQGDEHYMEISISPVMTDGTVSGTQGIIRDITQRRRIEIALRDSEAKYRSLVEGIVDVIISLDRDGVIQWVNPIVREMLGYESVEMIDRRLSDFVDAEWHSSMESRFREVLEGHRVRSESVLVARHGIHVYIEYSAAPILKKGQIVGIQCVAWDVTQRKRLECELRDSEERYRTLVENAGEAIATVNYDGVFLFMNATAACRLGAEVDHLVGKTMWDLFPRGVADRQMTRIREVLETGQGCNSIAMSRVQGGHRWYNTTIEPLRDSAGKIVSGLVIARDIDELVKAQDELEAYREKMIRAEQLASLGTLSATLAHELTQPLTVIRLSIQNSLKDLERIACPARVMEDLRDGLAEVASVAAIADRFRNFARRSAEKRVKKVAVGAIVTRVMDLLLESARRSQVVLQTEGLESLPLVYMPEKYLEQLVFALLQNAVQAADGEREAHCQVVGRQTDDHIELQFIDDCGGIAPEDLPQVFEPFFTTKPAGEGTGLGLCIVQRVVCDAHGQIDVRTDYGHGTTFVVTLPIPGD